MEGGAGRGGARRSPASPRPGRFILLQERPSTAGHRANLPSSGSIFGAEHRGVALDVGALQPLEGPVALPAPGVDLGDLVGYVRPRASPISASSAAWASVGVAQVVVGQRLAQPEPVRLAPRPASRGKRVSWPPRRDEGLHEPGPGWLVHRGRSPGPASKRVPSRVRARRRARYEPRQIEPASPPHRAGRCSVARSNSAMASVGLPSRLSSEAGWPRRHRGDRPGARARAPQSARCAAPVARQPGARRPRRIAVGEVGSERDGPLGCRRGPLRDSSGREARRLMASMVPMRPRDSRPRGRVPGSSATAFSKASSAFGCLRATRAPESLSQQVLICSASGLLVPSTSWSGRLPGQQPSP